MGLINLIAKYIVLMHGGTIELKVKSAFVLAFLSTPFAYLYDSLAEWYSLNVEFVGFVFGAIIIDHVLGSYVHAFVKRDFDIKKNLKGFLIKTSLVVIVFFLGRGVVSILGNENPVAVYFRAIMRLMVFLYPAGSALVNSSIITKGQFPPLGFLKKISQFNQNLDLKQFTGEESEQDQIEEIEETNEY